MRKRNGLALLLTLLALSLCLGLMASWVGLGNMESAAASHFAAQAALRAGARGAALRGLAGLQATAGQDVAYTYLGRLAGLCVGRGPSAVMMDGEAEADGLRWRWTVEDLSQSHDLTARPMATRRASAWAKGRAGRPKLPLSLPAEPPPAQAVALEMGGPDLYAACGGDPLSQGHAWQVRGLLTDSVHGGWKKDLSRPMALAEAAGEEIARVLSGPAWTQLPSSGRPICAIAEADRKLTTVPVLTDFRLSLGFFNSRHDGRHRLRFHGSGVLWNPSTLPLLAGPHGRLFLCEVVGAPEVTITNLDTGAMIAADLDDCPQEDFGVVRQGPRERGLWFWVEVADAETAGMAGRGLLPGETYAFLNPTEEAQPQGLARILAKTTWRLDRRPHGPGWRRPAPTTFLPADRIEVVVRFRQRVTVHLRPYVGEPAREEPISAYPSASVLTLLEVPFPDFGLRTSGEDYSREDSTGYALSERRACLRVRLKPRSGADFRTAAGAGLFERACWDFRRSEDAAEWSVESPLLSAMDVVDHDASPLSGPLWDLRANRHDSAQPGAFASVRLRDLPGRPHLSVGSLRHLEPSGGKLWCQWLDRGFFSAPLAVPEHGVFSHQPFLAPAEMGTFSAEPEAKDFFVLGPWNVNSRDPAAWEAFLRGATGVWCAESGGPSEPRTLTGPLFFTRPVGAGQPKWGSALALDLGDEALSHLPALDAEAAQGAQLVRRIDGGRLRTWSQKIVELQPACGWPFASLQAFADSGLLARSLAESGINFGPTEAAAGWPLRLEAADFLEAWAPLLTVRGDTFKVIGRAEGREGSATCELVVQRVAQEHDCRHLGRKFRIISVRFRNP